MLGYRSISTRVIAIGAKAALGNDNRATVFVRTIEQAELGEVAGCPARQFPEPLELPLVMAAPTRRISRCCRRFKLDEGSRRRALPDERYVRPPDAGIPIFRQHGQSLPDRQDPDQSFKQLLESRGKRWLGNVGVRSPKLPDPLRVSLQERDAHGLSLMCWVLSFIVMMPHTITRVSTFLWISSFRQLCCPQLRYSHARGKRR
jgi:hypothetical protein